MKKNPVRPVKKTRGGSLSDNIPVLEAKLLTSLVLMSLF